MSDVESWCSGSGTETSVQSADHRAVCPKCGRSVKVNLDRLRVHLAELKADEEVRP